MLGGRLPVANAALTADGEFAARRLLVEFVDRRSPGWLHGCLADDHGILKRNRPHLAGLNWCYGERNVFRL